MRARFRSLPAFAAAQTRLSVGSVFATYGVALVIFLIALVLRFWIDPYLPPGFPYLTFFPAVVICGFVLGVGPGTLVAVLSGLASWYYFIPPHNQFDFSPGTMVAMGLYVFVIFTDLGLIYLMMRAYRAELAARQETQRLADRQEVMAQELDHRLKNVFATINAIISLSLKNASTADELAARLRDRLTALGRSNLLLRGLRDGEDASLQSVVFQALEPFAIVGTTRFSAVGPKVPIDGQTVIILSLILHELGTNAAKYGALSTSEGHIALRWAVEDADPTHDRPTLLSIEWRESGGPIPKHVVDGDSPQVGFGSTLMKRVIAGIRGFTDISYPETGALVRLSLPLDALSQSRDPAH
ncbi:DUF4118 domain-containing protein [Peteryoungia desertarenae]|uniref:histidine kinase n=1 Tax=Peteryoungia desertarenae TaxID=1813451 RepID=A0ABX6QKT1_9HYPH|nr:HWE histidine kinase domain-containing protein [Peteryoungia desertarenae]QLF69163.1 DUF4118 domain-containing protein [Peteryoungia desertarenae]